jgi:hypothetical protein
MLQFLLNAAILALRLLNAKSSAEMGLALLTTPGVPGVIMGVVQSPVGLATLFMTLLP